MSRPIRRPLVGVVYHQIAHYRRAVFDALAQSDQFSYRVLSDTKPQDPTISLVDPGSANWDWLRTENVWIGPFLWQRGLVREALSGDYEALIFLGNFAYLSTWIAAPLARLRGRRVLFWTHGWLRRERGLKALVRRTFYGMAHGLLVYGHWAKAIGIELGFNPSRIYVAYNSLDYEAQRKLRLSMSSPRLVSLRKKLFPGSDAPIAICSARLVRGRRLEMLIAAAASLRERGRELHILLVGDGPARAELEGAAEATGVRVYFAGACYDEDKLAELTMAADVTVIPGLVGLTAIQSLAYGTPVITHSGRETQGPEWEAIEPGRTGDFFAPDDLEALVLTIERWISRERRHPSTVAACVESIERRWNPAMQRAVIERALAGEEADDLFALRRGNEPSSRPNEAGPEAVS